MQVTEKTNQNTYYYEGAASKADKGQESFSKEIARENSQQKTAEESQRQPGEAPEKFAGMSFKELMDSGAGRANQIPMVNQIVSARSPETGKLYRAFFTDSQITCCDAGEKIWELDVKDARQAQLVKEFFQGCKPDNSLVKEFYSGDNMGMAVSKSFWMKLFERAGKDS